jgi:hypothetical protein
MHWPHLRLPWFHRSVSTPPAPAPAPAPAPTPAPAQPTTPATGAYAGQSGFDGPLKVNLANRVGFTAAESAKLDQAVALLGKVLNSPEFQQAVLGYHAYQGCFANSDGKTNQQILDAISAGAENFAPEADHEVDLDMQIADLGWFKRNVVGYTTPDTSVITSNRRFFDGYTPAEIAGNLAHEWMHKIGFDHDFNATARRPYSVPYAIGDLVESLAAKQG